jgi:hypothetical protein
VGNLRPSAEQPTPAPLQSVDPRPFAPLFQTTRPSAAADISTTFAGVPVATTLRASTIAVAAASCSVENGPTVALSKVSDQRPS